MIRPGEITEIYLFGNSGDDTIVNHYAYHFTNLIYFGIYGSFGDDYITGSSVFATDIYGSFGDDVIYGFSGDDSIICGDGNDIADGGDGNDFIDGGLDDDVLYGNLGVDTIYGDEGADDIYGGPGADLLYDILPGISCDGSEDHLYRYNTLDVDAYVAYCPGSDNDTYTIQP